MSDDDRERDRRRLVELVVHDLRNPLAALLGNLDLLRDELHDSTASVREGLDGCTELATRALTLVATILDVNELEAGDLRVHVKDVELGALVAHAVSRNVVGARVRDVRIDVDVDPGMRGRLDPRLAERVLEHLVDNSPRYARRGGRIAVSSDRVYADGEDMLEIAVGNDGPPVPVDEREMIFGRNYRAEQRRKSAHKGLGLYFCKLAVEAHGGAIHVEERGDLGAVFVARVPE